MIDHRWIRVAGVHARRHQLAAVLTFLALALAVLVGTAPAAGAARAPRAVDPTSPCPTESAHPWCLRSLSPADRASLFRQAMTLQQEIEFVGGDPSSAGHTGATYAVPNLGLRQIFFTDGPVGPRQGPATAMPIPMALAATWSPALAWAYGNEVGTEARAKGNDFVFGPTVNLMRTPQGGRTYEAYGEDTDLAANMTVGWVDGAQAAGVIATTKHFVANEQEGQGGVPPVTAVNGGRMLVNVNVDERTLREVYFPQFEAAVKQAHTGAIMCAYNRVDGAYSCQNGPNLLGVLRGEWGFQGIILSDYGASNGLAQNPGLGATVGDLNNGLDFVPNEGQSDQAYQPLLIQTALLSGLVSRATLDGHVDNILRTLFAAGIFDRGAYANSDVQIPVARDQATAERVEQRAIVLLKNEGILPLKRSVHRIAVIGPYANLFVTGGGSGQVTPRAVVTALEGITRRAGRHVRITYANGYDIGQAAAVAKAADVAVVVVGDVASEGLDRSCIDLNCSPSDLQDSLGMATTGTSPCAAAGACPANGTNEDGLVAAVAAVQRHTVVVLETSGPVLTPWRGQVPAILEAWYPGQQGGVALARVLFGDADPAGRLPVTFPQAASQLPTAASPLQYPGVGEQENYSEGIFVGYKFYEARHETPAFPFGFGLSYTRFRFTRVRVVVMRRHTNEVAVARVTVTNTGTRAGFAVPELYVAKPATAALAQVPRQLVGADPVFLRPHRSAVVTVPLNDRSFASWVQSSWEIVPGCYRFELGTSSSRLLSSATVGRGAICRGEQARLGTTGDFTLPLAPGPSARPLR